MIRRILVASALAFAGTLLPHRAEAIPIFAQRYHLRCETCHAVLPELNAFGNAFRERGYRLDGVARHGTTIAAVRFQFSYDKDPGSGARRFVPAGVLLGAAEIGAVEAFVHENLGAQGGPAALYLGYLAYADRRSGWLYRAGLFELPLPHSNGQRNDTLLTYGYEGQRTGLDDLLLAQPRWGIEAERNVGTLHLATTAALGEYHGSAYGGKPIATGESSAMRSPEFGLYVREPLMTGRANVALGGELIGGTRTITPSGGAGFADGYRRAGAYLDASAGRFDLLAQQWWGRDANADGTGSVLGSSGGYVRVRYAPLPHTFLGVRFDAAAAPAATRDVVWYAEGHVTPHARLLVQWKSSPGRAPLFSAAVTAGVPWPRGR